MSYKELKDENEVSLGFLPESKEGGRLRNVIVMGSSGPYVKPAWLKFVVVQGVGGGGGGAGCPATSTAQQSIGGPGGGAGYFRKKILAETLAASETVTVGAAGAAGAAGANVGGSGGTTSFGAHCSATGGGGGQINSAVASTTKIQANSGTAGTATGGDINISGEKPPRATMVETIPLFLSSGASPVFGVGQVTQSSSGDGVAGNGKGSGGSGGQNAAASQPAQTGGAGSAGIVIIEEYE